MTVQSIAAVAVISGVALAGTASAAELQAYAGAVAGGANGPNCGTNGPTIAWPWRTGINLPGGGFAGCQLAGGIDDKVGAAGPLTAVETVSGATVGGVFTGDAQARADYWSLGASSSGTNTGGTAPGVFEETAAFARFKVPVTLNSPVVAKGAYGVINLSFFVDGSLQGNPAGKASQQADVTLALRVNPRPTYTSWSVFSGTVTGGDLPYLRGGQTGLPGNFVITPASAVGSATVTSTGDFSFQWGVPFDVEVALWTHVYGSTYGAWAKADFLNTARLTGIKAWAQDIGWIQNFSGVDGVGNRLGPTGLLAAIPEPGSAALLLAGLGLVGGLGSWAQRRSRPVAQAELGGAVESA
jgi:hypothetical protein